MPFQKECKRRIHSITTALALHFIGMAEALFHILPNGYRSEYTGIISFFGSFPETSSAISCCGDMHRYTPWCSLRQQNPIFLLNPFQFRLQFACKTLRPDCPVTGCLAHCEATTCLWHGLWWLAVTTEGLPTFSTHSPEAWLVATIYSTYKKLPFSTAKIKHIKMEDQILNAITLSKWHRRVAGFKMAFCKQTPKIQLPIVRWAKMLRY